MSPSPVFPTNPGANCAKYRPAIDSAIRRVLDKGWYILGDEVKAFEHEFAAFVGTDHALGVASGTDALIVALKMLGIGPGHAVLTVSHTAVATVAAIELAGATPVLVDIDPLTFTMDPAALAAVLADGRGNRALFGGAVPKAVIPVHLYGHMADMPAILAVARQYDLPVIEDCAQAHGARLNGGGAGSHGDLAAFSFYPTKNLGAIGDGGAVTADSGSLMESGLMIREYGWRDRQSLIPGMNSRLDELQAAILRVKLAGLAADNRARQTIARLYDEALADVVQTPVIRPGQAIEHVYHQYVIQTDRRDELQAWLREKQTISTLIHYPLAAHQQPAYSGRHLTAGRELTHTERACEKILSLPMYPELPLTDARRVADAVRAFFRA
ncbi:MAG: DegT/DnrJ/EryC1/StrS family aminotransferase [Lentisphaeria bacterium]|nr:DegT/DnrJ/EryC1/StrS family aminotransferase [Lentisphaeria bacterium]